VLHPVDGLLTHANHMLTGLPVHDTYTDRGGSTFFRGARAARLLPDGDIAEADLAAMLADHFSHPHSICRHADPRDGEDDLAETLYSLIMDLDDRRLLIAEGPPCEHKYAEFSLR
jgi:isopenicillin-N N-acyltransferase-like protein